MVECTNYNFKSEPVIGQTINIQLAGELKLCLDSFLIQICILNYFYILENKCVTTITTFNLE